MPTHGTTCQRRPFPTPRPTPQSPTCGPGCSLSATTQKRSLLPKAKPWAWRMASTPSKVALTPVSSSTSLSAASLMSSPCCRRRRGGCAWVEWGGGVAEAGLRSMTAGLERTADTTTHAPAAHLHQPGRHLPHALAPQRPAPLLHHQHLPPLIHHKGPHPHLVGGVGGQLVLLPFWQPVCEHHIALQGREGPGARSGHGEVRRSSVWGAQPASTGAGTEGRRGAMCQATPHTPRVHSRVPVPAAQHTPQPHPRPPKQTPTHIQPRTGSAWWKSNPRSTACPMQCARFVGTFSQMPR